MPRATISGTQYEYKTSPTDGVSLTDGEAWWGTFVQYRQLGARRWTRFNAVDVHSWDKQSLEAMIYYRETGEYVRV